MPVAPGFRNGGVRASISRRPDDAGPPDGLPRTFLDRPGSRCRVCGAVGFSSLKHLFAGPLQAWLYPPFVRLLPGLPRGVQ